MDEKLKEQNYVEELIEIIRSTKSNEELRDKLSDYHENDIADAFVRLDEDERDYTQFWERNRLRKSLLILMTRIYI